jgi:glyoxylase-like metal-dependent hydrolase (beta-lactamase superfamily II)
MAKAIVSRIDDNVVRLGSWIVNWYLLADDEGVTVIDAAVSGYRSQLEPGLQELGRTLADVEAVVLTHAHADHVGVAEQLRTELGIPVYVHRDDVELAQTGKPSGKTDGSLLPYLRHPAVYRGLFELARNGGAKAAKIGEVSAYGDGDELPVPGRPRVIHAPGHSDGHCALVAGDVLFAGDAICTLHPLTGRRGPQLMPGAFNRSSQQALDSLERLIGAGTRLLVPGHGEPARDPDAALAQAKRTGPT